MQMAHTQHVGITLLRPAPRHPCCRVRSTVLDLFLQPVLIMYFCVVFALTLVSYSKAEAEPVKMTLLNINHVKSEIDSNFQCYLSDTESNRVGVTMESMRTGWTRDTADENPAPPDPFWKEHTDDSVEHYRVKMENNRQNDAFGVFGCKASKAGKLESIISTTRMRSDADILPLNDLFTKTVNVGDTGVTIEMYSPSVRNERKMKWRHNNSGVIQEGNRTFVIDRPVQLDDAGIYECHMSEERSAAKHGLKLLIVRACPASYLWGPPDCIGVCDSCYNGGVCDERTGKCVCPPGFMGQNCQQACGRNRFGYTCDKKCSDTEGNDKCKSYLFCLSHPFGCLCNTGFMGFDCEKECSSDRFGASCLQSCNCTSGNCDRFTGHCAEGDTCKDGWVGGSCQECVGNFFGPHCSQKCHCSTNHCNRESGLCKPGGCLSQWVDLYPPYSCQTGLTSITYEKRNPGVAVPVTCEAVEGPSGNLDELELNLSRNPNIVDDDNITALEPVKEGTTKMQTFTVKNVNNGDAFHCQLRHQSNKVAYLGPINVDVFVLPEMTLPPKLESVNGTSITISWSAWNNATDVGDPPLVGYIPYYKKTEESKWIPTGITSPSTLMFTATGLDPETSYSFSVSAVRFGEGGEGPRSGEINVSTICDVPPGPKVLTTKISGERQELVQVLWELPVEGIECSSGITKFTIYYFSSETDLTSENEFDSSVTSYIVYNLTVGMPYTFYVTLSTSGGESPSTNHEVHLVPVLPVLNKGPLVTNASCRSVTMAWSKWTEEEDIGTPPISHYVPYHRVEESIEWIRGDNVTHNNANEEYRYVFYNLTEEMSFEFCVVAAREGYGGEGDKKNIIPGNTTACPVDKPVPVGLIVGSTFGGIVFIILIVILVPFWINKRKHKKRPEVYQSSGRINPAYVANPEIDKEDVSEPGAHPTLQKPVSIPVAELELYLQNCENGRCATLEEQFSLLNPDKQWPSNVGEQEENRPKNRFKNTIAYDHSRVVLEIIDDVPYSDYYNANYIKNADGSVAFVASQGPNKASVNNFWRMVVMENICNIVMLTNVVEGGKDRCFHYWPSAVGETKQFGLIKVTLMNQEQFGDYDIRNLHLQMGKGSFEVINWHFKTWPDKDVPQQTTPLIEFCNKIKAVNKKEKSRLLVHCSAGVGRTGTFIALYSLTDVLKRGERVDVYGFVEQMRQDRINMVQKASQYKFLHECLLEVYLTGDTKIPMDTMTSLDVNAENINMQFKLLTKLSRRGPKPHKPTTEESDKMRFPDIAPVDKKLPFLRSPGKTSSTNFIYACLVTSYRKKDAFIATQSPLPNTTEDFWRLVYDWRCPLIVMLNQLDTKDKTHCKYWPDNESSQYGNMEVTFIDGKTGEGYTHRQFDVKHVMSEEYITVHQMQLTSWDTQNARAIINFINDVVQLQQDLNIAAPTIIHCSNGVGRTGVFLAVVSELDRLQTEGNFDVFNTVRRLRGSHPNLVYTQNDYRLCHQLLKLACPESLYANI